MDLTLDLGRARYPAVFFVALGLSLYFTPLIRRAAIAYGVTDDPDGKLKQHSEPIAYLGGLAIYLAFLFALALVHTFNREVLGILLSASMVVMLGLFDDLKVLPPSVKLAGQVVATFVLMKAGIMIRISFLPEWGTMLLTVMWMVGITNAFNLIDVSDGLAAGVAAIAGLFFYVVASWSDQGSIAILTLALVGSTIGFLRHNRPPARIFMGDTGSMFLGFMLGALAMIGQYTKQHRLGLVAPVVILGVPIYDTFFVMGARLMRRIPIMQGSPDHFAVRMRRHGHPAGRIALVAYVSSALLGASALAMVSQSPDVAQLLAAGVTLAALAITLLLWRMGRGPEGS